MECCNVAQFCLGGLVLLEKKDGKQKLKTVQLFPLLMILMSQLSVSEKEFIHTINFFREWAHFYALNRTTSAKPGLLNYVKEQLNDY